MVSHYFLWNNFLSFPESIFRIAILKTLSCRPRQICCSSLRAVARWVMPWKQRVVRGKPFDPQTALWFVIVVRRIQNLGSGSQVGSASEKRGQPANQTKKLLQICCQPLVERHETKTRTLFLYIFIINKFSKPTMIEEMPCLLCCEGDIRKGTESGLGLSGLAPQRCMPENIFCQTHRWQVWGWSCWFL